MRRALLRLIAASFAASPAAAADWRWVQMNDETAGRRAWFIDKDSIVRTGDTVTFLATDVFRPDGKPIRMKQTGFRIAGDCAARTLTFNMLNPETGGETRGQTLPVAPKTVGADLLDGGCKAKFPGARVADVIGATQLMFQLMPRRKPRSPR